MGKLDQHSVDAGEQGNRPRTLERPNVVGAEGRGAVNLVETTRSASNFSRGGARAHAALLLALLEHWRSPGMASRQQGHRLTCDMMMSDW